MTAPIQDSCPALQGTGKVISHQYAKMGYSCPAPCPGDAGDPASSCGAVPAFKKASFIFSHASVQLFPAFPGLPPDTAFHNDLKNASVSFCCIKGSSYSGEANTMACFSSLSQSNDCLE